MHDNPHWLNDEIRRGLSRLMCLCLDSAPAADLVEGTAQAWLTAVQRGHVWDQQRDTPRFRAAFDTLLATCERWPPPRELLAALPPCDAQPRLFHERGIPHTRTERCQRLQELLGGDFNPAVANPAYDPSKAHPASAGCVSPEERAEAEAALAALHAHEEPTP